MKKLIFGVVLIAIALSVIMIGGDRYTARFEYGYTNKPVTDYDVVLYQDGDVVTIEDTRRDGNDVVVDLKSVNPGQFELQVFWNNHEINLVRYFYVHRLGLITADNYFGNCTNGNLIMIVIDVYLAIIVIDLIRKYRKSIKENFYDYRNVSYLAIIIFLTGMLIINLGFMFGAGGLADAMFRIVTASKMLAFVMIPLSFIFFLVIGINNVRLTIKEGISRNNGMGIVFCGLLLFALLFPVLLENFLQVTDLIDVHREFGAGHFFNDVSVNFVSAVVSYIVCVLIATAVMGRLAMRQPQHYNRNYIIILGCQIRKNGTLTPLLRGRVDAARAFAKTQEETTGLKPVFVPSGGKGADEVIPEAEAMKDYLLSCGISEDRILTEDKSTNTNENFKFSMEKIREHAGDKKVKVVFATTNYHVLRAGLHAAKLGINVRGIGSSTKFYFSSNAFIRECIAMLHYERRTHIKMIVFLFAAIIFSVGLVFLANSGAFAI